ncbi:MAG: putative Ig domain-containing protein, partial [bacterium]
PCRIWGNSAVYKNRLWVFGGFRSEPAWNNFNDVWYSSNGADWHELTTETIWSPRHEVSAYVFNGRLWVVAGNSWPLTNDVWYLEIPGLVFLTQPVIEEFVTAQYSYRARADFNESGQRIRYRLLDSPAWLAIDPETGLVRGTPDTVGDFTVMIEAYDDSGEAAQQGYTLHVLPVR